MHPPRRPRKAQRYDAELREEELLQRVRKLEGVVEGLRGAVRIEKSSRREWKGASDETKAVRLLAGKGRSRYVSDRFWASFSAEVSWTCFLCPIQG